MLDSTLQLLYTIIAPRPSFKVTPSLPDPIYHTGTLNNFFRNDPKASVSKFNVSTSEFGELTRKPAFTGRSRTRSPNRDFLRPIQSQSRRSRSLSSSISGPTVERLSPVPSLHSACFINRKSQSTSRGRPLSRNGTSCCGNSCPYENSIRSLAVGHGSTATRFNANVDLMTAVTVSLLESPSPRPSRTSKDENFTPRRRAPPRTSRSNATPYPRGFPSSPMESPSPRFLKSLEHETSSGTRKQDENCSPNPHEKPTKLSFGRPLSWRKPVPVLSSLQDATVPATGTTFLSFSSSNTSKSQNEDQQDQDPFISITESIIQTPDVSIPLSDSESFFHVPEVSSRRFDLSLEDPFLVESTPNAAFSTALKERGRARTKAQFPSPRSRSGTGSRTRARPKIKSRSCSRSPSKSRLESKDGDITIASKSLKTPEKPTRPPKSSKRFSRELKLQLTNSQALDAMTLSDSPLPPRPPRSAKRKTGSRLRSDTVNANASLAKPLFIQKTGKTSGNTPTATRTSCNAPASSYAGNVIDDGEGDNGDDLLGDSGVDLHSCTAYTGTASLGRVGEPSASATTSVQDCNFSATVTTFIESSVRPVDSKLSLSFDADATFLTAPLGSTVFDSADDTNSLTRLTMVPEPSALGVSSIQGSADISLVRTAVTSISNEVNGIDLLPAISDVEVGPCTFGTKETECADPNSAKLSSSRSLKRCKGRVPAFTVNARDGDDTCRKDSAGDDAESACRRTKVTTADEMDSSMRRSLQHIPTLFSRYNTSDGGDRFIPLSSPSQVDQSLPADLIQVFSPRLANSPLVSNPPSLPPTNPFQSPPLPNPWSPPSSPPVSLSAPASPPMMLRNPRMIEQPSRPQFLLPYITPFPSAVLLSSSSPNDSPESGSEFDGDDSMYAVWAQAQAQITNQAEENFDADCSPVGSRAHMTTLVGQPRDVLAMTLPLFSPSILTTESQLSIVEGSLSQCNSGSLRSRTSRLSNPSQGLLPAPMLTLTFPTPEFADISSFAVAQPVPLTLSESESSSTGSDPAVQFKHKRVPAESDCTEIDFGIPCTPPRATCAANAGRTPYHNPGVGLVTPLTSRDSLAPRTPSATPGRLPLAPTTPPTPLPPLPRCTACGFGFGLELARSGSISDGTQSNAMPDEDHTQDIRSGKPCKKCNSEWERSRRWYGKRGWNVGRLGYTGEGATAKESPMRELKTLRRMSKRLSQLVEVPKRFSIASGVTVTPSVYRKSVSFAPNIYVVPNEDSEFAPGDPDHSSSSAGSSTRVNTGHNHTQAHQQVRFSSPAILHDYTQPSQSSNSLSSQRRMQDILDEDEDKENVPPPSVETAAQTEDNVKNDDKRVKSNKSKTWQKVIGILTLPKRTSDSRGSKVGRKTRRHSYI
ncbi:hypothetical protein VKT23_009824 [Stygiomarasmius scandens]|uniref:Uncharacterized protein n=1 Tax=Marasmiellus scandens TaxID=2682957 RepID=A0ABR1IPC8_9AGAR